MCITNRQKVAPRTKKLKCRDSLLKKSFYRSFKCEICREKTPLYAEDHYYKNVCCMCGRDLRDFYEDED